MISRKQKSYFCSTIIIVVIILTTVWTVDLLLKAPKRKSTRTASVTKDSTWNVLSQFKDQYDPKMIEYIRRHHLTPPSGRPYNISSLPNERDIVANSFSSLIMDLAKTNKHDGIFIEAGAYDGVAASNTLNLELIGWKGLLVECNPQLLPNLTAKNRKAWIADVCLSPTDRSKMVKFFSAPEWPASAQIDRQLNAGEMKEHGLTWIKNKTWVGYERPAFPLYSIIAAAGLSHIDFLSLDVQGAEVGILTTYPFEKIPIKVIFAEIHTFPEPVRNNLTSFLASKGYSFERDFGNDYLFVLNSN